MKSDEELKKTFTFGKDAQNVVYLTYLEMPESQEEDIRQAQLVYEGFRDLVDASPQTMFTLLVDVTRVSAWRYIPSESRSIYGKIVGHPRIKRVAVHGSSILLGVAATLISQVSGKENPLKFFGERDEALHWLKR